MAMSDNGRPGGDDDNGTPFEDEAEGGFHAQDDPEHAYDDQGYHAYGDHGVEAAGATAELDLGDDDAPLPWLEGDEDEDEYEGYNTGQIVGFLVLAVAALALIVGGIWWLTRDGGNGDAVPDGSVIEAPRQPYKEKPADPGGKTFEGTGDSSYAVSEGQSRTAQLGKKKPAPKPGFDTMDAKAGAKEPEAKADTVGAGEAVQVGAYSTRESAQAGWNSLSQQYSLLKDRNYRIVEGQADIGTVYRLQVLPGSASAARKLCSDLKAAGANCHVK